VKPLTPRERRLVALGVLAAVGALVWLAIAGPLLRGFADRSDERVRLQATFQRNQRLVASLPAWRAMAEIQRRTAPRFSISASSEPLAVESLEERIRRLAADEGFVVSAIDDLQADAPAGAVRVRADMELTLAQLCDSLRRLETEGAYVIVEYLSISADRGLADGRSGPLAVRIELTAAYRPAGARSP